MLSEKKESGICIICSYFKPFSILLFLKTCKFVKDAISDTTAFEFVAPQQQTSLKLSDQILSIIHNLTTLVQVKCITVFKGSHFLKKLKNGFFYNKIQ